MSLADARAALRAMRARPVRLERPVVVLGGFLDPGGAAWLAEDIRRLTGENRVISVHYPFERSLDACAEKVVRAVNDAFPSPDPEETALVDVIGISMGGLVARHAAARPPYATHGGPRLNMARLFTISSPHRAAGYAQAPDVLPLIEDMRAGSEILGRLAAAYRERDYELYPYVQLGDGIVGAPNAAPPDEEPWWIPRGLAPLPHIWAVLDARILLDISRRLRGETPVALEPRAPVPG